MKFINTKHISDFQKCQLLDMWHDQYPVSLAYENMAAFENYLTSLINPEHILLVDTNDCVQGWLLKMVREKKDWIAIILDASIQFQGYGSQLLNRVKATSNEINAWVVDHNEYNKSDGSKYQSPLNFYIKNDFLVIPKERLEQSKVTAVKIKWQRN